MEYYSDMFQHGIMTKWFDPTDIPLLKAMGYSAVKRYCKVRRRDTLCKFRGM